MVPVHGKTETRTVAGGKVMNACCPACKVEARFHEVEVTTAGGVFFIDLLKDTERAFRCTSCGEVFGQRDDAGAATAPPPTTRSGTPIPRPQPPRDLRAELEAEAATRAAKTAARNASVDAELAALKRKLGK